MSVNSPFSENQARTIAERTEQEILTSGHGLTIPDKFKYFNLPAKIGHDKVPFDNRTELPIIDDRIRTNLAQRLAEAIRNGEGFALIHSDADYLKSANAISRDLGNLAIMFSITGVSNIVGNLNLPNAEIYTFRGATAGDESYTWIFGLDNAQLSSLSEKCEDIDVPFKSQDLPFNFSTSYSFISSANKTLEEKIQAEKVYLAENDKPSFELYNTMTFLAEEQAHYFKLIKEIVALPNISDALHIPFNTFRDHFVEQNLNKRISGIVLNVIMNFSYMRGFLDAKDPGLIHPKEQIAQVLKDQLNDIKEQLEQNGYPRLEQLVNSLAPQTPQGDLT